MKNTYKKSSKRNEAGEVSLTMNWDSAFAISVGKYIFFKKTRQIACVMTKT